MKVVPILSDKAIDDTERVLVYFSRKYFANGRKKKIQTIIINTCSFSSIFRSIIPVLTGIQCLTNTEIFGKWKTKSKCHVDGLLKLLSDSKLF